MNPTTNYDVIIIGAGPSGIFCAYELIQKKPGMKILMVGKRAPHRKESLPKTHHQGMCGLQTLFHHHGLRRRRRIF